MLKVKLGGQIILGLDKENIRRLTANQPIHIKAESLKVDEDIFIVYGETLSDIVKELGLEKHIN